MMTQEATLANPNEFIFAGQAVFTVQSKATGTRFTYRVSQPANAEDGFFFVGVLTGPDNTRDFSYLGFIRDGEFIFGRDKPNRIGKDAPSWKAFDWFFGQLQHGTKLDQVDVHHEGRCGRCGRELTTPESIERGIGPVCLEKMY